MRGADRRSRGDRARAAIRLAAHERAALTLPGPCVVDGGGRIVVLAGGLRPAVGAQTMGWEVVMAYLIPPMADEPPPEYIAFVAARLGMLRAEAARLIGGDRSSPEVVMQVLTDLAGHWRRLCWRSRLTHRDAAGEFLDRRLTVRTRQWREEQIYPVEVNVLPGAGWTPPPEQVLQPVGGGNSLWASPQDRTARPLTAAAASARLQRPPAPVEESLARQLASFLPSTVRRDAEVVAEAEIAWVHAYRRYLWRRYCRAGGGFALLIGAMVQFMSQFSTTT